MLCWDQNINNDECIENQVWFLAAVKPCLEISSRLATRCKRKQKRSMLHKYLESFQTIFTESLGDIPSSCSTTRIFSSKFCVLVEILIAFRSLVWRSLIVHVIDVKAGGLREVKYAYNTKSNNIYAGETEQVCIQKLNEV